MPKSKKKTKASSTSISKNTSKAKTPKSKSKPTKEKVHNMQELYLDNVDELNAHSHVEAYIHIVPNSNVEGIQSILADSQIPEAEKGITAEIPSVSETNADKIVPDSPSDEESQNTKIVEEVLNSLKYSVPKSHVVPDVPTSMAQEKPTSDVVGAT
ncbi:hypothetical protein QL285_082039 [Trifolium repens]|nr:hypothetical protein QL285_082039 [Trifolium repens]